jgi:hypothetical protein
MVQPNCQYRGTSANAAEVRDVNEAFARSVLWAFPVAAASEGRVLVDFTEFLVRDGGDIAGGFVPIRGWPQHGVRADDDGISEEYGNGG